MKKLLLTLILGMFLISFVSAFEIDNRVYYENNDLTFRIENAFGLPIIGSTIGKGKLTSHSSVDEPIHVSVGKDKIVMTYDFYNFDGVYENAIGYIEFTNMKTGKKIFPSYSIEEITYEYYEVPIQKCWDRECYNQTMEGVEIVKRIKSITPYTSKDIPNRNITLALVVDVQPGDYIDAKWNLLGKQIKKHASWTSDMNDGLIAVWDFNDTSGELKDKYLGNWNMTAQGDPTYSQVTTILPNAIDLDNDDDFVDTGANAFITNNTYLNGTMVMWIKPDFALPGTAADRWLWGSGSGGSVWYRFGSRNIGGGSSLLALCDGSNAFSMNNVNMWLAGTETMVTISWDIVGDLHKIYINNTLVATSTTSLGGCTQDDFYFGQDSSNTGYFDSLIIDAKLYNKSLSLSEVDQQWNGGLGIEFSSTTFTTNLNSPDDNAVFFSNIVPFNCSAVAVGGATITNISLYTNQSGTFQQENITIGLSGTSNETTWNHNLESDGNFLWNCLSGNSDGDSVFSSANRTLTIDTIFRTINILFPNETINYHKLGDNLSLNWTLSNTNLDSCWFEYNNVNTTVTCLDNNSSFLPVVNIINLTFYANDSSGNTGNSFTNWSYNFFQNSETFNTTVLETSSETFEINISALGTGTVTANFIYNGTDQGSTTKIGDDSEMRFQKTIDIPIIGNTNTTFFWNLTSDLPSTLTTETSHFVNSSQLALCNTTISSPYINFTFKNETINQESITATITSTWNYFLGTGSIFKSLSFSNSSENPSYAFCFNQKDRTLFTNYTISYNNQHSQQRIINQISVLSNITTNQVLYLLPNILGLFSPFQTIDNIGDPISNVKALITRTLGSSTITIASVFTDSSGFVTFFLNPDVTYTALFTKSGFTDNTFSFVPTTDLRTVTMGGGGVVAIGNGTQIAQNTSYLIKPTNSSLNNGTDYTFSFEVNSSQNIILISMNITNSSGFQLGYQENAGTGIISQVINTGNNRTIIGKYVIQTDSEILSLTNLWIVGIEFVGDYSIFKQLTLYHQYGFTDFMRLLIVFFIIISVLIFMSAGEITDTSESKVIVAVLLVWAFSVIGWLDTGMSVETSRVGINKLGQYASQYGIAILTTSMGFYFIARRVFIRRI